MAVSLSATLSLKLPIFRGKNLVVVFPWKLDILY